MARWEPLGMRTAWPVLMSMASHDWFKSRRKASSIMDPFTTTRERPISADQFASHTSVLERMRVAGAVAQFGPDAAVAVTALLNSPDDESRKLGVAITSVDTLAIARPLLKSRNCASGRYTRSTKSSSSAVLRILR